LNIESSGKRFAQEDLYELVWSKPIRTIAKEFGISDVALAKKCRKLGIPRPPVGYWQMIAFGQKVRRPFLPKTQPGQPESVWIPFVSKILIDLGPEVARRTANLDLPENQIHVRDSLRDAHPLIRLTRDLLNNSRHDDYGAQLGRWHEGSLNIRVSKASGGAPCSSWMHC